MNDERKNLPSASAMHRYAVCPGSWALSQGVEPEPPGEDAERGTRIHKALEEKFKTGKFPSDAPQEELGVALRCDAILHLIAENHGFTKCKCVVERRMWWRDESLSEVWSGKADLVLRADDDERVLVVDWKTGRGDVDQADTNMQLRALAVLAFEEFYPHSIIAAIIQPDAHPQFSLVEYDRDTIEIAIQEVNDIIKRLTTHAQIRNAGPHCRYCPARVKCAEYAAQAAGQLPAAPVRPMPPMDQWTPQQWSAVLDWLPTAERWLDEVKTKAKERLEADPACIPGWMLKPGQSRRTVSDVQQLFNRMNALGVTAEQFASSCSITVKAVTDLVAEATGLTGAELKRKVSETLDGVTEDTPTAPQLKKK